MAAITITRLHEKQRKYNQILLCKGKKKRTTDVFTSEICVNAKTIFIVSTVAPIFPNPLSPGGHCQRLFIDTTIHGKDSSNPFVFRFNGDVFFFITFFSFQSDMIRCSISKFKFRVQRSDIAIDLNITFRTLIVFDVSFYQNDLLDVKVNFYCIFLSRYVQSF